MRVTTFDIVRLICGIARREIREHDNCIQTVKCTNREQVEELAKLINETNKLTTNE